MSRPKLIIRIIILTFVVFFVLIFGIKIRQKQLKKQETQTVVILGAPKAGQAGLQKELNYAFKQVSYIKKGNHLLKEGNIDEAIKEFETALSLAKTSGSKGGAHFCLANAYEKKKDYKRALEIIEVVRDEYTNDWAKGPVTERALYLEYALKGEYELAVEHAENALEEDKKLPNVPKGGSPDYIERLNDLKAAKDYILSFKKSNQ